MSSNDQDESGGRAGTEGYFLKVLENRLEHQFQKPGLLALALTHPSVSADPSHMGGDYERLEFLGDRVLGLVVAEMLFARFPKEAEGKLARRHAQLVRKETLASVARDLDLGCFMRLEMGEGESSGRNNPSLLSDTCEAVIAALYLDGGLDVAQRFIATNWFERIEADIAPPSDSKTRLQEWAQGRGLPLPNYAEVARSGPAHAPMFTISVEVQGYTPLEGEGPSKRIAEQDAATKLLSLLEGAQL
ncbi:ribonuclease III [Pelagibius litoralis]|uniref:Ribonuclease 3 n=1 Tax=Pelagibius litoralis TaxID=374515 RepID=A0A967C2D6_9PROT|nr:ribonuclease III [Pelagibius litoralis]NIA66999.1 ribonuclease III [Pelagibius litoralis]